MTEKNLATCHCIIGHPSKPKFMAIQHTTGWDLPTLKFPAGYIDFKATMISEGMNKKYGLTTHVLRSLWNTPDYHCIELELQHGGSTKNIKAVWVDREKYLQFRSDQVAQPDPCEQWLKEKELGEVPALRSPWQFPGWFKKAEHWIQFQLDRLDLQVTGSVQQHRVGWNASCLLRVPTSAGMIYFKAGYFKPPGEAAITMALASRWPEHVIQPLAADLQYNWMLNYDFGVADTIVPKSASFPGFVSALAKIQLGSVDSMQEWDALDCPHHGLDYLLDWIGRKDELMSYLREGGNRLSDEDIKLFSDSLAQKAEYCRQLAAYGIPDTLVHRDFRDRNLIFHDGAYRIIDWTDVVIGHPFFSLDRLFLQNQPMPAEDESVSSELSAGVELLRTVTKAYLEAFLPFAPMEQLEEALLLSQKLFLFWQFCGTRYELDWAEKGSPQYILLVVRLQNLARRLGRPLNGQFG